MGIIYWDCAWPISKEWCLFSLKPDVLSTFWVEIWNQGPKIYPKIKFELELMKNGEVRILRWHESWKIMTTSLAFFHKSEVHMTHMILPTSSNFIWLEIQELWRGTILPPPPPPVQSLKFGEKPSPNKVKDYNFSNMKSIRDPLLCVMSWTCLPWRTKNRQGRDTFRCEIRWILKLKIVVKTSLAS